MCKQQINNKEQQKQNINTMVDEYIENEIMEAEENAEIDTDDDINAKECSFDAIGTTMSDYLKFVTRFDVISAEEEVELFKRFENGDRDAYETIYNHNLRLVVSVAKRYFHVAVSMDPMDLIMDGNIGLANAIQKFDYRKGYKFSTYAIWWIKQAVTRGIYDKDSMIRVPIYVKEAIRKYLKYANDLEAEGKECPSLDDIRKELGLSDEQVRIIQNATGSMSTPASLNKLIENDGDSDVELMDFIPSEVNIESDYMREDLKNTLLQIVDQWITRSPKKNQERQRDLIIRRFGFETGVPETLESIANDYGITRERVRQIEEKFIKFARQPHIKRKLQVYRD